jgi:hypothetical protein
MITDEMIEAGAEAIKLRITECFGVSVPKELAQACLEAALQAKLTEQDKLPTSDEIEDAGGYAGIEPERLEVAIKFIYDKRTYKSGRE